jgi:ubiquinone/menaquinone biosynthesis C-methylase UbiE
MLARAFESEEYQDFLISEQRKGIVAQELYNNMIGDFKPDINILDFGCGLGYVSVFYSEKFKEHDNFRIYSCDHQVEVLDLLWKRIADNKFKNITPFFMPDQSRLHFPSWIPECNYIFFSFSLSATESPVDILKTIAVKCAPKSYIHIIDWDKSKSHEKIDDIYPVKNRLHPDNVRNYLDQTGYEIIKDYKTGGPYFAFSCRLRQ